jgi:hypothetical protein
LSRKRNESKCTINKENVENLYMILECTCLSEFFEMDIIIPHLKERSQEGSNFKYRIVFGVSLKLFGINS